MPKKTFFHCFLLPECPPCLEKHVEGEGKESAAYKAMYTPLTAFDDFCTCPACFDGEPPQQHASSRALNKTIETKATRAILCACTPAQIARMPSMML
jgi:hypothetical protein